MQLSDVIAKPKALTRSLLKLVSALLWQWHPDQQKNACVLQ